MKTKVTIFLLVIIFSIQQNAKAQMYFGVYGFHVNSNRPSLSEDIGGGFGMNFLSKNISLNQSMSSVASKRGIATEKLDVRESGMKVQFGGNFFYSWIGQKSFDAVPLLAPQTGLAKVDLTNAMWGINFMTRFSYVNKTIFTPYVDGYVGYRNMYSTINVYPNDKQTTSTSQQHANQNDKPLASINGLNYGVGGGILTKLSDIVQLDLGVIYSEAYQSGHLVDLKSAYADKSGINANYKNGPNGMVMIKVGLLFYIRPCDSSKEDCNCSGNGSSSGRTRWGGGNSWGGSHSGGSVGTHFGGGGGGIRIK